ncbi:HD domain-containing protein [Amycolatopsis sp. NPDC023774]|uniref:HD domain-containing protein n=1 Tax=Amycolatopsis sp. NPDC023774 TaxID=3155015 RepID=UPI0033D6AE24
MTETIAGAEIPDTALVRVATDLDRAAADDLLFDHSRRVYLWGTLKGRRRGLVADPELFYVNAMFHDLGLPERYRTAGQRFELDGADVAHDFLLSHGYPAADARKVWLGIALHTTPGVPDRLAPETALVTVGVETDALGFHLEQLTPDEIQQVLAAHPRPDFKNRILKAFHNRMKDRQGTTFGTMNDDVLAYFEPGLVREDFVSIIKNNDWPE